MTFPALAENIFMILQSFLNRFLRVNNSSSCPSDTRDRQLRNCHDIQHSIGKSTMEKPSVDQIKQIVRNLTENDDPVVHKATVEK